MNEKLDAILCMKESLTDPGMKDRITSAVNDIEMGNLEGAVATLLNIVVAQQIVIEKNRMAISVLTSIRI